jgi:hypothetical protein
MIRILPQGHPATAQGGTLEPEIDVQAFDAMQGVLSVCMPLFARAIKSLRKGPTVNLSSGAPW